MELIGLIGGFWFFLFMIVVVGVGIVSNEFDSFFGGAITLVGMLLGLQFLFGVPIWQSIVANPLVVVLFLIAYVAIGFAYGIWFRYADFLRSQKDRIKMAWGEYARSHKIDPDVDGEPSRNDFRQSHHYREFTPYYNSEKIIAWVALWPWGVFWDLCHKPIRWSYNNLYALAGRLLDRVSDRVSDKILNEK